MVANAPWAEALTNARCGQLTGTMSEMRVAEVRLKPWSGVPLLGLENAYCAGLGIDGTAATVRAIIVRISRLVFQPTSGSTGDGSVSR